MLDLLRKLGILRYGVKKAKFTSGKDMPPEFLMDDVYDAEKDLVNKEDVQKVRKALKTSKGKTVLKWIVLSIFGFLAFFFILGVIFGTDEPVAEEMKPSTESHALPASSGKVVTETGAASKQLVSTEDEINMLFEHLRQATLDEEIDDFMKYYADDFPNRIGKKQKTLETWARYDFDKLDFVVSDFMSGGDHAQVSVRWQASLLEEGSRETRLIETTNEVELYKKASGWQIVDLFVR